MSIDQTGTVDIIHIDDESNDVVLTITDHLDWNTAEGEHLLLLQEKLNTYLRFVESGEILEQYPKARGRRIVISVAGKYGLSDAAKSFYAQAKPIIEGAGMGLEFKADEEQSERPSFH
jgi:CRP-like cAMP-binding protein